MRRRGGVSASVISEAEATSYVKKVDYKMYEMVHLNYYFTKYVKSFASVCAVCSYMYIS